MVAAALTIGLAAFAVVFLFSKRKRDDSKQSGALGTPLLRRRVRQILRRITSPIGADMGGL